MSPPAQVVRRREHKKTETADYDSDEQALQPASSRPDAVHAVAGLSRPGSETVIGEPSAKS